MVNFGALWSLWDDLKYPSSMGMGTQYPQLNAGVNVASSHEVRVAELNTKELID